MHPSKRSVVRVCTVAVLGLGLGLAPAVTATAATAPSPADVVQSGSTHAVAPVSGVAIDAKRQNLTGTGVLGATVTVVDAEDQRASVLVSKLGEWKVAVKGFTGPLRISQSIGDDVSAETRFGASQVESVRLTADAVVGYGTPFAKVIVRDAAGERRVATVDRTGFWTVPSEGLTAKLQIRERLLGETSKPVAFGSTPAAVEVSYRSGDHLVGTGTRFAVLTVVDAKGVEKRHQLTSDRFDVDIAGLAGPLTLRQTLLGLDSGKTTWGEAPAAPVASYRSGDRLVGTGERYATVTVTDANGTARTAPDGANWNVDISGLTGPLSIHQTLLGIDSEKTTWGEAPAAPEVSYRSGNVLVGTGERYATVTVTDANGTTRTAPDGANWNVDISGLTGPLSIHQTLLGIDSETITWGAKPAAPEIDYRSGDRLVGTGERYATVTITDANGTTRTAPDGGRWVIPIDGLVGPLTIHQTLLGLDSDPVGYSL